MYRQELMEYKSRDGQVRTVSGWIERKTYKAKVTSEVAKMLVKPKVRIPKSKLDKIFGKWNKNSEIFVSAVTLEIDSFFCKVDKKQKQGLAAVIAFQKTL